MSATSFAQSEEHAKWLLADLLLWHRREKKPDWWMWFERIERFTAQDFIEDSETLGGLQLVGQVGEIKNSFVWRFKYDNSQEHKIEEGRCVNPATRKTVNVVGVDHKQGYLDITQGKGQPAPAFTALIPASPIDTSELERSLQRLAEELLSSGTNGAGKFLAARRLLGNHPPQFLTSTPRNGSLRQAGEDLVSSAQRLVSDLDRSTLAIQGPPGTGKTYTAARVIVDLIQQGKKVGISAFTHAAISTLLTETLGAAQQLGVDVSIVQKVNDESHAVQDGRVTPALDNGDVTDRLTSCDVVAGTAWLFSREEMIESVDTLIVDEAGQLSLANVLAIAPAATNLVLVGDPQQLAQPSKLSHPGYAGRSALEHLLDGAQTIRDDFGILLDETRRLHPSITSFISEQFYDSRLTSFADCAKQRLTDSPFAVDSGLIYLPVDHAGNRTRSAEEATQIQRLFDTFLGQDWVDSTGNVQSIGIEDIIVITPYNNQVAEIALLLPDGARVGTVDKLQGKEAAIVFISMAASSAQDIPRGLEFLLSHNRLNVAISRAKVMSVLLASPLLASTAAKSIDQMKLVNSLCRYIEMATPATSAELV